MSHLPDWSYRIFTSRHRWLAVAFTLLLLLAFAAMAGLLLSELGVLYAAAAFMGLFLGLWMLTDIEVAYWSVIGVVCLLPAATFPFDVGFTPTLLDAALGGLFLVWAVQITTGHQRNLTATSLGLPTAILILLASGSFVFGLAHAPLTPYSLRHFAELLMSISLIYLVANTVRQPDRLDRIVRVFILAVFGSALVGIGLYLVAHFVSEDLVIQVLSWLQRFGYPAGEGVIRYVEDNPELMMRATAMSIDPNVLGNLLVLGLAVGTPQIFAERPLFPRWCMWPILGTIGLCLVMTISRSALVSAGVALGLLALLRYRKLRWMLLGAFVLILILPPTQEYVAHFIEGLQVGDLATQMRMGEYRDALTLIGRYPWLGVGFSASPDIDMYIGVSNVYLLIAEQMGVIGLAGFLVLIVTLFVRFWQARVPAQHMPRLEPIFLGLHVAICGALVGGIFDHYIFNLDFHYSVTLFWLIAGLATATVEMIRQRAAEEAGAPTNLAAESA